MRFYSWVDNWWYFLPVLGFLGGFISNIFGGGGGGGSQSQGVSETVTDIQTQIDFQPHVSIQSGMELPSSSGSIQRTARVLPFIKQSPVESDTENLPLILTMTAGLLFIIWWKK